MAYIVSRKDGRFEIRESMATPRGPRSRTLATFRRLSDEVLDHAESRARTRFDRRAIRQRAETRGVPQHVADPARRARRLLEDIVQDRPVPSRLIEAIRAQIDLIPRSDAPDTLPPATGWLGATAADHGDALRDLLRVADRIPMRPRPDATPFPRIRSAPA